MHSGSRIMLISWLLFKSLENDDANFSLHPQITKRYLRAVDKRKKKRWVADVPAREYESRICHTMCIDSTGLFIFWEGWLRYEDSVHLVGRIFLFSLNLAASLTQWDSHVLSHVLSFSLSSSLPRFSTSRGHFCSSFVYISGSFLCRSRWQMRLMLCMQI